MMAKGQLEEELYSQTWRIKNDFFVGMYGLMILSTFHLYLLVIK